MEMLPSIPAVVMTLLPQIGAIAGAYITKKNIPTWYETKIKKPSWRPPNKAFPIVWNLLFLSMGFASYLIYRDGGGFDGAARLPLILYAVQLVLNWAWSFIFFWAHNIKLAFYEMVLLVLTIVACLYTYRPINEIAFYLMLPYLAWVSFATCLTFSIWRLNAQPAPKKNKKSA